MKRLLLAFVAPALGLSALSAEAAEGKDPKAVFVRLCAQCHGPDGGGMKLSEAPAIAGLPEWYLTSQLKKFKSGIRGTHPADLFGTRMAPMARYLRVEGDLEGIAAYVAAMKPVPAKPTLTGGSVVKGEQRFQVCAACHGVDGMGNKDLQAPKLVGQNDWYLLNSLKNFKAGGRGGDPVADPMAAGMRANAQALDDQGMLDVIAYINVLAPAPAPAATP